jgi:hypothetical protein
MEHPTQKQFKLIRTITIRKVEDVTTLTPKLDVLRLMMERHQSINPDYDYAIVDEQGNPAELADFLESELAHPVAKAKRKQAALDEQIKAKVIKKLARMK